MMNKGRKNDGMPFWDFGIEQLLSLANLLIQKKKILKFLSIFFWFVALFGTLKLTWGFNQNKKIEKKGGAQKCKTRGLKP